MQAEEALLSHETGLVEVITSGSNLTFLADDLDFLSGLETLRGDGILTVKPFNDSTLEYRLGTAAENVAEVPWNFEYALDLSRVDMAAIDARIATFILGEEGRGDKVIMGDLKFNQTLRINDELMNADSAIRANTEIYANEVEVRGDVEASGNPLYIKS